MTAAVKSVASIYFDYRQAFYKISRVKLMECLEQTVCDRKAILQVQQRHEQVCYRFIVSRADPGVAFALRGSCRGYSGAFAI